MAFALGCAWLFALMNKHGGAAMNGRVRMMGVILAVVIATAVVGGLGGCSGGLKAENERLTAENAELRTKTSQYEAALGALESERAALEGPSRPPRRSSR